MANKVKFNIHDVHYAPITAISDAGVITYGTPIALKGARSIAFEPQDGDNEIYYADGLEYYIQNTVGGYEGDLEMALIDDAFRKAIYGEAEDTSKLLWESINDTPNEFALGFVIDGDASKTYFWYQKCKAGKPSVSSATNEASKTIGSDTITVNCSPTQQGFIRVKSTDATDATVLAGWFNAVISSPSA